MKSAKITFILLLAMFQLAGAQEVRKAGYPDWTSVEPIPFDEPDCWSTSNGYCTAKGLPDNVLLTPDAYSGTYALFLQTSMDSIGMPLPGVAIFKNAIQDRPDKLTGFYRADLKGDDYASIRISLLNDRGAVGYGSLDIAQSSFVFTPFEVPLHYLSAGVRPDSFIVFIYSSFDRPVTGTSIVVDELKMESQTDVTIPLQQRFTTRISPNPAVDEMLVEVPEDLGEVSIRIFDDAGQNVEYEVFECQIHLDVSNLIPGMYYYEIRTDQNRVVYDKGRFKVSEHGL